MITWHGGVAEVKLDYILHQACFCKEKQLGHSHRRLPSEGKRMPNMQSRLTSSGSLLPPQGPRVKDEKRKFRTLVRRSGHY